MNAAVTHGPRCPCVPGAKRASSGRLAGLTASPNFFDIRRLFGLACLSVLLADGSVPLLPQGAAMWAHDLEKRQHIVAQQKGLNLD